ncbi:MAG: SCO family protein [Gemmataceae bacterium]
MNRETFDASTGRRLAVVVFGLGFLASLAPPAQAQSLVDKAAMPFQQRLGEQAALDGAFRDQDNRPARLADYCKDRPVILVLAYFRCPRLCNVVFQSLVDSLKKITLTPGKDFQVVVVSIDPREGPALARPRRDACLDQYGDSSTIDGWHFLTGGEAEIKKLADSIGYAYVFEPDTGMFRHSAGFVVLTPGGKIARYFLGIDYPPTGLRLGLVEASEGKIGSLADDAVLLTCFAYDAEAGRYVISPMKLMRAAALLTILILGVYLGRAWLKKSPAEEPLARS